MFLCYFLLFIALLHSVNGAIPRHGWIGHRFSEEKGHMKAFNEEPSWGCQWRGMAPFCDGSCVGDEIQERKSANRTGEEGFGAACWTGEKAFCCLQQNADSTWQGYWKSSQTESFFICSFIPYERENTCGVLACQIGLDFNTLELSKIRGKCNEVSLFGMNGTAENGKIVWQKEGRIVDKWYKGRMSGWITTYLE